MRSQDGSEFDFDLSHLNLPMREGQMLKVTQVSSVGANFLLTMRADNLTTGVISCFKNFRMGDFFDKDVWNIHEIHRGIDFLKVHLLVGGFLSLLFLITTGSKQLAAGIFVIALLPSFIIYMFAQALGWTPGGRRRKLLCKEILQLVASGS